VAQRTLFRNAYVYDADARAFARREVLIDGQTIAAVGENLTAGDAVVRDLNGAYLCPGLVDAHTHGRKGFDFSAADEDALRAMALSYVKNGVTCLYPTLATAPLADWIAAADRIRSVAIPQYAGIHLEGRYLNPDFRGAHSLADLRNPDAAELAQILPHLGKKPHVTAALELDADGSFTRCAMQAGATLSLGHTGASFEQASAAFDAGATALTHTFNAMPGLHHRKGGPICAAVGRPVYTEFICDGIHIQPEMVRLAYRMQDPDYFVLVTDSLEVAGMPDGEYRVGSLPITFYGGKAMTLDGHLAGSTLSMADAVNNLMQFCGLSLAQALYHATLAPARELGIADVVGSIEPGKRADLLIAEPNDTVLHPLQVFTGEKWYDCND